MSEEYKAALAAWNREGGTRPASRPDGISTRCDPNWFTPAERAIYDAVRAVEAMPGDPG